MPTRLLQGDALKAAIDKQNWDDSIKSLAATPDVLDMMSNKLDWTQQLSDARWRSNRTLWTPSSACA